MGNIRMHLRSGKRLGMVHLTYTNYGIRNGDSYRGSAHQANR